MRTTIDIPDAIYADLKMQAAEERTTIKALLDQAARQLVSERRRQKNQMAASRPPWPTIGSADGPKIAPFDNDYAFFGGSDSEEQ